MVWTRQWVAAGLGLWAVLASSGTTARAAERPAVIVHVDNRAGVPPDDLGRARVELETVFHAAGVEIAWSDGGLAGAILEAHATTRRRQVVVMLVNGGGEVPGHTGGCPLGFAIPPSAMAYVFYNRIRTVSRTQPVDADVTLGRVIAHEVGHLLLPPGRHPNYGIMRATLDLGVKNPNRFSNDEARKMHDALSRWREP